jgi:hypothetical protein
MTIFLNGNTGCFTHLDPLESQNLRSKNFQKFSNQVVFDSKFQDFLCDKKQIKKYFFLF